MSLAQWQAVIDVNLTGVFLCTREVAAKMVELKSEGAIINISSISRAGNMGQTNYSAAKAGVASATVTWAKELARYGIRVAGIAPGFIETEMTLGMKPEEIGRASCRERVCQYVSISVIAVSLQKTSEKISIICRSNYRRNHLKTYTLDSTKQHYISSAPTRRL